MCGMKLCVVMVGKWDGIVWVMRFWRDLLKGEVEGGISQREAPGMLMSDCESCGSRRNVDESSK